MTPIFIVTIRIVDHKNRRTTFRCNLIKDGEQNLVEYDDRENHHTALVPIPQEFMQDLDVFLDAFGRKIVERIEEIKQVSYQAINKAGGSSSSSSNGE